jgi:hypothetical protein
MARRSLAESISAKARRGGHKMRTDSENRAGKPLTRKEALKVLLGKEYAVPTLFKDVRLHILVARNGAMLITGADVFEFQNGGLEGLSELHSAIDEALGFSGSKHDRTRICHTIVHGCNFVCQDKSCTICHKDPE